MLGDMEPLPLRLIDHALSRSEAEPGDMWRYVEGDEAGRECWWIVLPDTSGDVGTPGHPGRLSWRTTQRASDPPHVMWEVAGEAPNLTVTPSIDILRFVPNAEGKHERQGSYFHGFITNGIITSC